MAGSNNADTIREANDERLGQYASAKRWLGNVVDTMPTRREDVDGMFKRLDLVQSIADRVSGMVKDDEHEAARAMLEFRFDPALVDATTSMNRLIDILGGQMKTTMEAAAASKAETYRILFALLAGGTLVTVLVAMALVHNMVARPLHRLAAVMREIAQGRGAGVPRQRRRARRGAGAAPASARTGGSGKARGARSLCTQFRAQDPQRGGGARPFCRRA